MEAAGLSFSAVRFCSVVAVFFDFQVFPSLSRRWVMESLAWLGLPEGVLRLIAQLYADCESLLFFAGEVVGTVGYTRGINKDAHERQHLCTLH